MNSIDPVNYLSCTILGLKTALFEAQKENQSLQKLLLSFYVKDAAKETNLYRMNLTGVKMNESFQKEKQDLNLKIQELEARLTDSESENLNLHFQIKELKAFLEEKNNLLELYNTKDTKSEKLILNSLKEKDLIQIIKNVLACMKKGRVSRELQKSLKKFEYRRIKSVKKIKSEDTDAEMSDVEIDLMSRMIENRLEEDTCSIKFEKNELSGFQSVHPSSETPAIDLNENDLSVVETNSSHDNAMDYVSMDQSIFSPLSIADSDYSSNGIKSVESLNSERVQADESTCATNTLSTEGNVEHNHETNVLPTAEDAKPSYETDALLSELNAESASEKNILPAENDVKLDCKINCVAAEIDAKFDCETDILPSELNAEHKNETCILSAESDVKLDCKINCVRAEIDAKFDCETDILPPKLSAEPRNETNNLLADSDVKLDFKINGVPVRTDAKLDCETDILLSELNAEPRNETNILLAESDVKLDCKINGVPAKTDAKLHCETNILPAKLNAEPKYESHEINVLPVALDAEPVYKRHVSSAKCDIPDSVQKIASNPTKASIDVIQSDDSVLDQEEILECDPFIDPKAVRSVVGSILEEMVNICYSNVIIESFREFCKKEISTSNLNAPVRVQIIDKSSTNETTSLNLISPSIPQDVNHEPVPVERKTDISSQESDRKKIRLDENVSNSAVECTMPAESTHTVKILPLGDMTNENLVEVLDDNPENMRNFSNVIPIDRKLVYHEISVQKKSFIDVARKPSGVFLPNLDNDNGIVMSSSKNELASDHDNCLNALTVKNAVESEIGTPRSRFDESINFCSDFHVTPKPLVKSVFGAPNINEETSICETEKDLFRILNEFASLEEQMHQRITAFREFLLQEDNYSEVVLDKMEYIVVAEILENSDLELSNREDFMDGSSLPDEIINSLHKTSLKVVELQTSKEDSNVEGENRLLSGFNSATEVNDTSDDEKDELMIVEDDYLDNNSVADTVSNEGAAFHDEENDGELVSANASVKLVSNCNDEHHVLEEDQPIKEIMNIPRYNFRRLAVSTDSTRETSLSLCSLPIEDSTHSIERSSESMTSTVEEPPKTLKMKFYVENQMSASNSSLCISDFDEAWIQIKLNWCENSSNLLPDTSELIPCQSSIMQLVMKHGNSRTGLKVPEEKVQDLSSVKKSLEVFLKEKIRNDALAFNALSKTVYHSNKTTLCRAVIDILLDSVTSYNVRRNENILRDLLNLSIKLDSTISLGFVDALKNDLKMKMWAKDWKVKENGSLVNDVRFLSKFFTRLCKLNDDSHSVISFLRECLFSFKFRGHPIAYSVLNEWPEIFPRDANQRNSIAHIILFTLVNHKMDYNENLYNIGEVQHLIVNLFNVKLGVKTAEEHAKELMLQFNDPTWEDAITLLCKRQMFTWTYTNVIMKYLFPILKKWTTESFPEEVIIKVLRALRTLLGACPMSRDNEMYKLDLIANTLEEIISSQRGSRELKETIILVLSDLISYRFSLCVEILEKWKPDDGVIRQSTLQLLRDKIRKSMYNGRHFQCAKKNLRNTRENKRERINPLQGFQNEDQLCPSKQHAVIAVGLTKKMNKNRPVPNRLMKNNPIPNNAKKKKKTKKRKTR